MSREAPVEANTNSHHPFLEALLNEKLRSFSTLITRNPYNVASVVGAMKAVQQYFLVHLKCPVLFLNFHQLQANTFKSAQLAVAQLIVNQFMSNDGDENDSLFPMCRRIRDKDVDPSDEHDSEGLARSLKDATKSLRCAKKKKVLLLIVGYDQLLKLGRKHKYEKAATSFLARLLSCAISDNTHIRRVIMTGYRFEGEVAPNNLTTYGEEDRQFSACF